jgi:transposase-like protein
MGKKRRHHTAGEKVAILRRLLVERVAVSQLCDEHDLHPTLLYRWQKEFFEHGTAAFQRRADAETERQRRRVEALEAKLRKKDEVLGELLEEHVTLKKSLGDV